METANKELGQQTSYSEVRDKAFDLKAKYETIEKFYEAFSSKRQFAALSSPLNYVIDQSAPQLKTVDKAYGGCKKGWMQVHIKAMLGFLETDESDIFVRQIDELMDVLFERFRNEKVTVFILFCAKCRAHDYKISYGTVKVDAILEAAGEFFRDCLFKLKQQAGYELQKADKETNLVEDDGWKNCRTKNLMWAWRDGTIRLWDEQGEKALSECLTTFCLGDKAKWPEHHLGICAMLGIGALWADQFGRAHFNNENFEAYIESFHDVGTYYPKHEEKHYNR